MSGFEEVLKGIKIERVSSGSSNYHIKNCNLIVVDPLNPQLPPELEISNDFTIGFKGSNSDYSIASITTDSCIARYKIRCELASTGDSYMPSWEIASDRKFIFTNICGAEGPRQLKISRLEKIG